VVNGLEGEWALGMHWEEVGKHGFTAVQRDALACSMLHAMVLLDSNALAAQGQGATRLDGRPSRQEGEQRCA
jgi:hypothetical protein